MKTFWKLLGVLLVSLPLWGCDGQPEKRPSIAKWKEEVDAENPEIPILGI